MVYEIFETSFMFYITLLFFFILGFIQLYACLKGLCTEDATIAKYNFQMENISFI